MSLREQLNYRAFLKKEFIYFRHILESQVKAFHRHGYEVPYVRVVADMISGIEEDYQNTFGSNIRKDFVK